MIRIAILSSSSVNGAREVIFLPSGHILEKKKKQVELLASEFKEALIGILADYSGVDVSRDISLRAKLRKSNISYKVIKNNIVRRALETAGISGLDDALVGSTAVAIDKNDYSNAPKILCDFVKDNEFYKIKGGFVDGKTITIEEIKALASLPSKEELIAQVLRGLNSPILGLACVFKRLQRSLVTVMSEISKQKK